MSGTDAVRTSLAAVASLLAPARPAVGERVLLAHDHPERYVNTYAAQLANRGIDGPVPNLARTALVDALGEHRLLAECDWKEQPAEIRARLEKLASRPSVDPWVLFGARDMRLRTAAFLEACGRHYRDVGATLAVLDTDSDCYPVVCLRAARAGELTALAGPAGIAVRILGA
ncbi:hypothetical protein OG195_38415 [Streptomyces sp. NBC_01362]|uniref:DUF6630 family protein n=1 Tax=Streptomyces sp. NBC_01362 TaxID=2903839 RepID=UPI002E2EAB0F|nr:hypothetical protein [Streptomyces sp. NBC_01362]